MPTGAKILLTFVYVLVTVLLWYANLGMLQKLKQKEISRINAFLLFLFSPYIFIPLSLKCLLYSMVKCGFFKKEYWTNKVNINKYF